MDKIKNQSLPVTKQITVDVEKRAVSPLVYRLGEGGSRGLKIRLSKEGKILDLTGTAQLIAENEGGSVVSVNMEKAGDAYHCTLPSALTGTAGVLLAEIRVTQGSSVLITPSFLCVIEKSLSEGSVVFTDGEEAEF